MSVSTDPITLTVMWNRLIAIANDMSVALGRSAYSDAVREAGDFGTHVYDHKGRLVAQGLCSPGHLGASLGAVQHTLRVFSQNDLSPGDSVVFNVPSIGTGHLNDFVIVTPAFMPKGELVGFTASSAHHADIGGISAGSQSIPNVTELYQEGIIIPPSLLVRNGIPTDIYRMIMANVRLPIIVGGDVNAQLNANQVGVKELIDLAGRHGLSILHAYMDTIIAESEKAMRTAIRDIPNGQFSAEDYLDDYGPDTPPIRISVEVHVKNDEILVDFEGTSDQVPAGLNVYLGYAYAYSFFAIKCLTDPDLPQNHGSCLPVKVTAPEGSFCNAKHPAACSGRAKAATRIATTIMLAMHQAVPERTVACSSDYTNALVTGVDPGTGRLFAFYQIDAGGFGARPTKDGNEAMFSVTNAKSVPIEVYETTSPIVIERHELVRDSGGPGHYRGGCAYRRDVRVMTTEATFTNLGERYKTDPFGLEGGRPGARGNAYVNHGSEGERPLESKGIYKFRYGDVVSTQSSGAGGYGDPLKRAPEAVLWDVIRDLVSVAGAARDYGVVIDPDTQSLDIEATTRLRERLGTKKN